MVRTLKLPRLVAFIVIFSLIGFPATGLPAAAAPTATSPTLGGAESYSVLAGSIVTNTGPTTVSGDLGISPSIGVSPHFTGFPPGVVGPPGTIHDADAHAGLAQAGNTAAFTLLDQPCTATYAGVQDLTLVSPLGPGVYCADAFLLTGNLTLNGSDGVWIFKSSATLTTSAGSSVTGGDPCNVWWRLASSASIIGTNSTMIGNLLALTDINMQTGATLDGRALTQTGQVTLQSNIISGPVCNPTAVELLYFRANRLSGQQVQLEWATALEVDNFGFNLYRANVNDQKQANLIHFTPSFDKGGSSGATYTYIDTVPEQGTWWYWLADVDMQGHETLHTLVIAAVQYPYQIFLPHLIRE
jgi:hypothetical protein